MKKTLNVVLAVVLAVAMIASFAYVATPERSNEYQLSLVSAKAVNVQDTTQGVRSYADLVDASRIYQVNEVIYLAITSEVKNLEKYPKLKSIEDKDIKVYVGSPSIDLSYSKLTTPTLLANVWSGYTATDVATVGYLAPAGSMLSYDKDTNEVSWTFRGVPMYGMGGSSHQSVNLNLVTFDPTFDTAKKKIEVPAIKLKDKDTTWTLGGTKFDTKFEAPSAIGYTMVLTGVTKDNAGAQKGTFYAKIQISAAEKFEDCGSYYQTSKGLANYTDTKPEGREWLDWVKVDVDKLEISGGYTVYKYFLPSSAMMYDTAFFYNGNESTLNGANGEDKWVDNAAVVAHVNPELFDNATNKTDKIGNTLTAGGVKTTKAYATWLDGENGAAMKEFPLTSIVYSNNKAYYAPGFYGGTLKWGKDATLPNGGTQSTERVEGNLTTGSATETVKVVEYYDLSFIKGSNAQLTFNAKDIMCFWSDTTPGNGFSSFYADATNPGLASDWTAARVANMWDQAVAGGFGSILTFPAQKLLDVTQIMQDPNGNVKYEPVDNGDGTYIVRLYPSSNSSLNLVPLNKSSKKTGVTDRGIYTQSMILYYRNPNYTLSAPATGFTGPNRSQPSTETFIAPMSIYGSTTSAPYYCPVFKEKTKEVTLSVATSGLSFEALEQNWLKPIYIKQTEQVTDVRASLSYTWRTSETILSPSLGGLTFTARDKNAVELKIPIYDFTKGLPSNIIGKTGLLNGNEALNINDGGLGVSNNAVAQPAYTNAINNSWYGRELGGLVNGSVIDQATAANSNMFVYGYKSMKVVQINGSSHVTLSDLVRWDPVLQKWQNCTYDEFMTLPTKQAMEQALTSAGNVTYPATAVGTYRIDPMRMDVGSVAGAFPLQNLSGGTLGVALAADKPNPNSFNAYMSAKADFTFYKDPGQEADDFYYSYDSTTAAKYSMWDDGAASIVEGHNGITVYSVVSYDDERPYVAMATETAYYDSDDGYGIALYDGYNLKNGVNTMAKRIYRTNASNLAYSDGATHVPDSAKIISALSYFGLDTSFDTTFRVQKEVFESKGAAAVFSEAIEGDFSYGTISIVAEQVEEGTEDTELDLDGEDTDDVIDEPEPSDDGEEDPGDDNGDGIVEPEQPEETPAPVEPDRPVPPTGDVSSNVAVAMTMAAIIAAAGLAFVMKKVR